VRVVVEHAVDLIEWVWSHTVAADWARRERVLRADIISRTTRLATQGWAAVLPDLGRDQEWLGDGQLRINRYDLPSRELEADADLFFIPVHARGSWVGWDIPRRYAIYYPVTGALARIDGRAPNGLARLVGHNRATLLHHLDLSGQHLAPGREHGPPARHGRWAPASSPGRRTGASPEVGPRSPLLAHRSR